MIDVSRRINLIPRSERPRTTTDVGLLAMVGLIIVVLFAIGFGYYVFKGILADREQELADLQQQTAALQEQVAALEQYERLQVQRQDFQAAVQGIYASRTLVSEILEAVSLVVPENVWFQNLALSTADPSLVPPESASEASGPLTIEGQTYTFEDVARMVVRLQLIPSLQGVELSSAIQVSEAEGSTPEIKGFSLGASVVNVHADDAILPLSDVEVEG
jgi:Tfp pilus assembly protein PilN